MDVNVSIADEAARIRAQTGLKLPDAIIAATGTIGKAKYVITNDTKAFKKASKVIEVRTPEEFMSEIGGRKPTKARKNSQKTRDDLESE